MRTCGRSPDARVRGAPPRYTAPVIYLLYGKDGYRVRDTLRDIRARLAASDEMCDGDSVTLDGRVLSAGELLAHATAMPFLSSSRLVVVEGLLAAIGEAKRGGGKRGKGADDPLEPWRRAAKTLADPATMPETTTLVFVDGELAKSNPAFTMFAPIARTIDHPPLSKEELPTWIAARAKTKGVKLAPRSLVALVQLIGPDLWALDNELDKLSAFACAEVVEPETVTQVVSSAREAIIWDLTDALVAGDEHKALATMRGLLDEGGAAQQLLFMVVRQFRQLVLVKDLRERGVRADEVARAAAIPPFRLSAVSATASRFSWPTLRRAYATILGADLSVKRGLSGDEDALQLLIHELCSLAPASGPRPAVARR